MPSDPDLPNTAAAGSKTASTAPRSRKQSISGSLFLLTALVLVLILGVVGAQMLERRALSIADAQARMAELDGVLSEQTSRALGDVDTALRDVVAETNAASLSSTAASPSPQTLRRHIAGLTQVLGVDIVTPDGQIRVSSRLVTDDHLPSTGLKLMAQLLKDGASGGTLISEPIHQSDGSWTALEITRLGGTNGGAAVVWLNLGYFESFYQKVSLEHSGSIVLQRQDGVVLVRSTRSETVTSTIVPAANDEDRIIAVHALAPRPLTLSVSVGKADALAGWDREALVFGLFAATAALIIAFLMLQLARRSRQVEEALSKLESMLAEERQINVSTQAANADMAEQMVERDRAAKALRQIQRVEAVGQLTAGVAHDFNNLLTVLLGNLELLQSNSQAAPFAQRLSIMRSAAERGASLIAHLMAFSRRQPLVPRAVDLAALITGMQPLLQSAVGSQVALAMDFAPGTPHALVDPSQFELMILNLAINSRDAMPAGGTLHLAVTTTQLAESHAPDAPQPGPYVSVRVTDTGIGMTEEVRNRAFEPYFTTRPLGTRSGLGLSQVYGVARQSGGQVRIDSKPGTGTTVTVLLPVAEVTEVVAEPVPVPLPAASQGRAHLLVVDDDTDVRATTALLLRRSGYDVTEASTAEQALSLLTSMPQIELLLSDVVMPQVTGPELARRAHALRPNLPVVFFSGYADPESIAGTVPMTRLLRKPFRPADLTNMIETVLAETRVGETTE